MYEFGNCLGGDLWTEILMNGYVVCNSNELSVWCWSCACQALAVRVVSDYWYMCVGIRVCFSTFYPDVIIPFLYGDLTMFVLCFSQCSGHKCYLIGFHLSDRFKCIAVEWLERGSAFKSMTRLFYLLFLCVFKSYPIGKIRVNVWGELLPSSPLRLGDRFPQTGR